MSCLVCNLLLYYKYSYYFNPTHTRPYKDTLMKAMKALFTTTMLAAAMTLTACGGGSSNSSGEQVAVKKDTVKKDTIPTPTTPTTPAPKNQTGKKSNVCETNGSTVYATPTGCIYSSPGLNKGADITYTCSNGRVTSNVGISAASGIINLNGVTITCKP